MSLQTHSCSTDLLHNNWRCRGRKLVRSTLLNTITEVIMHNVYDLIGVLLCSFGVLTLDSYMRLLESQAITTDTSFVEVPCHTWIISSDLPRLLQWFPKSTLCRGNKPVQASIKHSGDKIVLPKLSEHLSSLPVITIFGPLNADDTIVCSS